MDCGCGSHDSCCCTVSVSPGQDIQAAIDSLPEEGGCVCLKTGLHEISDALRIESSFVILRGESPGVRVVRRNGAECLRIAHPDPGQDIDSVDVIGINFEFDNTQTEDTATPALIVLRRCNDVKFVECDVACVQPGPNFGVTLFRCVDLRIENCRIARVSMGVWVTGDSTELYIFNNDIIGALDDGSVGGLVGMQLGDAYGPCRVLDNRVEGYLVGISLNKHALEPDRRPSSLAANSVIAGNHVKRGEVDVGDSPYAFFAIDVGSWNCRVSDNRVVYASLGGIRAAAQNCTIEGNQLNRTLEQPVLPLAYGILIGQDLIEVLVEDAPTTFPSARMRVQHNRMSGQMLGIVASDCDGLMVLKNDVECPAGVTLSAVDRGLIEGNRLRGAFGVMSIRGNGNQIGDNVLENGSYGALFAYEHGLAFTGNRVADMSLLGVMGLGLTGRTSLTGNRISNAGHAAQTAAMALVMAQVSGSLQLESNRIRDTGVPPTGAAAAVPAYGIVTSLVDHCQLQSNDVGYSSTGLVDPMLEHRALLMWGGVIGEVQLAPGPAQFGRSTLQALDNRLAGPGLSALVEFGSLALPGNPNTYLRFNRVAFNNNLCYHEGVDSAQNNATVLIARGKAVVAGNMIEATNGINAVNFHNGEAVYIGNVAPGGAVNFTDFPNPQTGFNR